MEKNIHLINDIIKEYLCDDILNPLLPLKRMKLLCNMDPAIYIKICGFIETSKFVTPIELFPKARIGIIDYYDRNKICFLELKSNEILEYGIKFEDADEIIIVIRDVDNKSFISCMNRIKKVINLSIFFRAYWDDYGKPFEIMEKMEFGKLSIYNCLIYENLRIGYCMEFFIEYYDITTKKYIDITNLGCKKVNIIIRTQTNVEITVNSSIDILDIKCNNTWLYCYIQDSIRVKTFILDSVVLYNKNFLGNVDVLLMTNVIIKNINNKHPKIAILLYDPHNKTIELLDKTYKEFDYSKEIKNGFISYTFDMNHQNYSQDISDILKQKLVENKKKMEYDIIKLSRWKTDLELQISKKKFEQYIKIN